MPRKAKGKADEPKMTNSEGGTPAADGQGGGTIAGYFRQVFRDNPQLLRERSNDALYQRWLADHPGNAEVPPNVKTSLQNLKSVLRNKAKKRKAARTQAAAQAQAQTPTAAVASSPRPQARVPARQLEVLEQQIDDCLMNARGLDAQGLEDIILALRRARNLVVQKLEA